MKISDMSLLILKNIYDLSMQDAKNQAKIEIASIAKSYSISPEYVFKCLTYLFDKEWIIGENNTKLMYGGKSLVIKINASGIDLVEN